VDAGNANIYGHVSTGPNGTVHLGNQGGIGSLTWQNDSSNRGKPEPGWTDSTSNFTFPETSLPSDYATYAIPTSGYVTNGITVTHYDNILVGGNKYQASSLSGSTIVLPGSGSGVTLVLPNGLNMGSGDQVTVQQNASITVYSGGTSCAIGGNGVVNDSGLAQNFILYCAPTVKSFDLNGNGSFTGVFVGPSVDLTLDGGGKDTTDFVGSILANSVTLNGHFNIHYDEALGTVPSNGRFLATSWDEIPVTSVP
jgi:hypothetical protein